MKELLATSDYFQVSLTFVTLKIYTQCNLIDYFDPIKAQGRYVAPGTWSLIGIQRMKVAHVTFIRAYSENLHSSGIYCFSDVKPSMTIISDNLLA